jgi:hybrid cluster-associated redox disulfide protein
MELQKSTQRCIIEKEFLKEECSMAKVEKTMIIGELIRLDENIIPILMREGMHCIGCPSAQMETLEEAALVHGMDPDVLVARINNFLEATAE